MSSLPPPAAPEPVIPTVHKITLPISADFSQFKKVCFISSLVESTSQFSQYLASDTYPVIYDYSSDGASLKASLLSQFKSIDRVSFAFHGLPVGSSSFFSTRFLNIKNFFDVDANGVVIPGGESQVFLQDLFTAWNVKNVDFLGCSLLQSLEWKQFFGLFQNVVVGASLDDTGNVQYGGNWMMENTMQNIRDLYFNSNIGNYTGLLTQYTYVLDSNNSLNYTIDTSNKVTFIGINGYGNGVLTVPSSVNGRTVIGVYGLQASYFVSIIMPSSITSIGSFQNCTILTSVVMSDNITVIPENAFAGNLILATFNMPTKVVSICKNAFGGCYLLTDAMLAIPNTCTTILDGAFGSCRAIRNVVVPGSVRNWGDNGYGGPWGGSYITSIVFGEGILTVPYMCCFQCYNLAKISLPKTLTTIGQEAFKGTNSGKPPINIIIPSSVTFIGYHAFNCNVGNFYWCGNTIPTLEYGAEAFLSPNGAIVQYCLNTVVDASTITHWRSTPNQISAAAMFTRLQTDSFSVLDIYEAGFLSFAFLQTQYTIPQMYTGGITVAHMYAGGVTFAEMTAADGRIASALPAIIAASASSYVPSIPTSTGATVTLSAISTLDLSNTTIVGVTATEQKAFTSSTVAALFSANTAQKQLILPIGSVLPGFSAALETTVYLINASSSIANNQTAVVPKSTILGQQFYVLLESGDSVTLNTNSGTVLIAKSGSVFTLTTNAGASSTKSVGDSYSYDGLQIVLGSIYGILMPSSVNFVLSALNSQIQLSSSCAIPDYAATITSDATITLSTSVSASVMQNTFYFRGDQPITVDASFVYYYVDSSKWSNKSTTLSPKNGIVTSNAYVASDTVGKDFLRDLARQLFGTYLGADLFTNEDSVVADINSQCDTVAANIVTLLNSIDITTGTFNGLETDGSGNKYLPDNTSTSNITRELFNELITSAPTRFSDLILNYTGIDTGFYKLPILAGDTITFQLTISPAASQISAVPTGPTTLSSRSYTIILNVGA